MCENKTTLEEFIQFNECIKLWSSVKPVKIYFVSEVKKEIKNTFKPEFSNQPNSIISPIINSSYLLKKN